MDVPDCINFNFFIFCIIAIHILCTILKLIVNHRIKYIIRGSVWDLSYYLMTLVIKSFFRAVFIYYYTFSIFCAFMLFGRIFLKKIEK